MIMMGTRSGGGTSLAYTPLNPANNLSDVASASAARTNLGLGSAALLAAAAVLAVEANLSDVESASAARTNLGLSALATVVPGTGVATALAVNTGSAGAFALFGGALGAATATSLAIGGATIGTNALAVTGTALVTTAANKFIQVYAAVVGANNIPAGLSNVGTAIGFSRPTDGVFPIGNLFTYNTSAFGLSGAGSIGLFPGSISATPVLELTTGLAVIINGNASLFGEAANTLAQRNGATAQAHNIYNTYTDASNYERAIGSWKVTSNVFVIGTEAAGTGAVRGVDVMLGATLVSSIRTTSIGIPQSLVFNLGTGGGGGRIVNTVDSRFLLQNNAADNFDRLQFGGTTSSFPALKRSATILQARLADDSAFAPLQGSLRTSVNAVTGLTAGVLSALTNASIVITDASGQDYRVPCII